MKALTALSQELIGLVVDDGLFAAGLLFVVAVAAAVVRLMPDARTAGGAILVFGCLSVLFVNVLKFRRY